MAKLIDITGRPLSGEWGKDDENGDGIPVLRTTNFTNEGVVNYDNVVTRTITKKNIDDKFLRKGDIIIEKSGGSDKFPVGRVIYFNGDENTYLFNNFTGLLRVKDKELWYPKYVFYSLYANYKCGGTRIYENKTTGLHNLKTDDYVSRYEIKEIDMVSQISICEKLDMMCKIVKFRKRELQLLDELVRGRFVELFGDPVINNKGWSEALIGDNCFVTKLAGFEYTKYINYDESGDVVMVKAQNVKNGKLNRKELSFISNEVSDSLPRSQLASGDIVMTYVGANIGDVAVIDDKYKYHLAPNVAKIRPDSEIYDPTYFMYMLMLLNTYIFKNSADTAKAALGMERIRKLKVFTPPIETQRQFADFAHQVDKSKLIVQKELDETQLLFDSLMQEYFG